jgi:N-acetylmuramoyl-L-alanine amidase
MEICPNAKIIINRALGETVMPLQNANFANKLDIDLYLSIHAFAETETKPRIFIYQFSYQDSFIAKDSMSFYSFDKIYLVHEQQTAQWANRIYQTLSQNQSVQTKKIAKIPFKPLIGIKAPAIGLELGLKNKANWHEYLNDLVQSIAKIINQS